MNMRKTAQQENIKAMVEKKDFRTCLLCSPPAPGTTRHMDRCITRILIKNGKKPAIHRHLAGGPVFRQFTVNLWT